jgi:hypothetical protein
MDREMKTKETGSALVSLSVTRSKKRKPSVFLKKRGKCFPRDVEEISDFRQKSSRDIVQQRAAKVSSGWSTQERAHRARVGATSREWFLNHFETVKTE